MEVNVGGKGMVHARESEEMLRADGGGEGGRSREVSVIYLVCVFIVKVSEVKRARREG